MKNIIIKDNEYLNNLIKKFNSKNFHIVADFDKTLTKATVDGQKSHTTIAQIREGNYLSESYMKEAHNLFDIYHPFEINNDIAREEKCKKMYEWWTKHLELMIKCGMHKEIIEDIINKRKIVLREKTKEFFSLLGKNNIPILIISAGLGDLIKRCLESEGISNGNLHIISNFYKFGNGEKVIGYKSKIIHSLNKNEVQVKGTAYENEIKKRKNVILLGDSLEDIDMTSGLEHENIIKIGFLNENVDKNIEKYSKTFDVLILNDGTMGYVNNLLNLIIKERL
ncbi:haloacid dehalogenase-like hydrolase [Candidatus Woesearchaeota archaeon]|nr:haloacid dehalogenase-like hydrolase [Candidatus Woesearchaeota archaeon]